MVYGPWFSVLVNRAMRGCFQSQRDLRQGDPLSPCLFIIATKLFISRLRSLVLSVSFGSVSLYYTSISYLSFADNIVIFVNGRRSSVQWLMDFLHHYKAISGQLISQDKSNFYIGMSVSASC